MLKVVCPNCRLEVFSRNQYKCPGCTALGSPARSAGKGSQPQRDWEARKDDQTKDPVDLVPVEGVYAAARAFAFGAKKYNRWNWSKGMAWSRLLGATLRHLYAFARREETDPESGLAHLDHALASLMMLQAHTVCRLGTDDRPDYNRGESQPGSGPNP